MWSRLRKGEEECGRLDFEAATERWNKAQRGSEAVLACLAGVQDGPINVTLLSHPVKLQYLRYTRYLCHSHRLLSKINLAICHLSKQVLILCPLQATSYSYECNI